VRASNGTFTTFDEPSGSYITPPDINPSGEIAGSYFDANGNEHGFLRAGGGLTTIDAPGST
jgi:hypothetical protein